MRKTALGAFFPRNLSGDKSILSRCCPPCCWVLVVDAALLEDHTDSAFLNLVDQWHTLVDETLQLNSTQIE